MFSNETREEAICRLHSEGKTVTQIRRMTGIRYDRVKSVIEYYEQNHTIPPPTKNGRPPLAQNDILAKITLLTVQNRSTPCWLISQRLQANLIPEAFNS